MSKIRPVLGLDGRWLNLPMPEIKIIGSQDHDEDDCERGERGKRGKRGPRGHEGPTGPAGTATNTGATGPTGFTGSTGPTGPNAGLASYGYAVGTDDADIDSGTDVTFDQGALVFRNIVAPAPGGTSFTILEDGDYEYNFYAVGQHNAASTTSMLLGISLNGVAPATANSFRSNQGDNDNDRQVVRGEGIITLLAGTVVTLRNLGDRISFAAAVPGGGTSANRTLSLIWLAPPAL
jgi:hypothetical protein